MLENFIKATDKYTDKSASVAAPYIRKSFSLDFSPKNARVFITASGFYELYINGENITKGYLAPYISNPDDMLCYDEYDVTKHLKKGRNAIGVILGNGFANQCVSSWDFDKASFRAPLCVSLTLEASGEGQTLTVSSDESFRTHPSHIIYDMYRYGTHCDARLEISDWCSPDFDDTGWSFVMPAQRPKGELIPCTASPITVRCELTPVSITAQKGICYLKTAFRGGEDIESTRVSGYLYDFGKSCAGVCRLRIKGDRSQMVTVRHCEHLANEETFNLNSIYTIKDDYADYIHLFQTDVYTLSGEGTEIFVPPFTYHGFRYALVEGITPEQATPELLTYEVLSSDISARSDFSCSDGTVNTLYGMAVNADLSNFHYFPTDCPHREKNGWTGDISVSSEQLLLSFDCSEELRLWLRALSHAQRSDGALPGIVPTGGWGFAWGNGPMWDSACINLPFCIYKYDGRPDIIEENADTVYRYLKYIASKRDENGLIAVGLGDWCQPRKKGEGIASPLIVTDSAITYDMAKKSAFLFKVIGQTDWEYFAERLAAELRSAIRTHLIDYGAMTALGSCQTSQALFISLGLFEESERDRAYKRLLDFIYEKDGHIHCGMIGLRYIFEALALGGDIDLALEMICRDDEPSYAAMIKRGATSLCEALAENGLNESENHHFFGDIIRLFICYIAGLRINPYLRDVNEVIFSPTVPSCMDKASGSFDFKSGKCDFGWVRSNKGVTAYINVPSGVHGKLVYNGKSLTLKEGYNEFGI